ncbi:helix-turn-helix transcriptional regulator [Streptomyces sp. NBC_00414]|uniref:helix-turn-helix transcriptional regulator n=1 Tax=Streptomyces sp. NBC_00414 TaxID=2975739 RepID=UPI002E21A7CF
MCVPTAPPPTGSARTTGHVEGSRDNALGQFLRSRRPLLTPADVGLGAGGRRRRVEGLRRQEVSVLAQVSADYYSRLEQGRKRNPSPRIVEALARALQLDPETRSRLFRLAGLNPSLRPDSTREHVHPELLRLLDTSHRAAAYALSPSFDVMAANPQAQALLSPFGTVGGADNIGGQLNLIRTLFTHPEAMGYYSEWPLAVTASLHALRLNTDRLPGDTGIADLVADLSAGSATFTRVRRDRAAGALDRAYETVVHPVAGRITLAYRVLGVPDAPGQHLLVGTPAADSRSAEALTYLAAMGARQP